MKGEKSMQNVKSRLNRVLSCILILTLAVGTPLGSGLFQKWETPVYAESAPLEKAENVNVTLVGSDGEDHPVLAQKMEIDNFDLSPFLTDATDYTSTAGVKMANALVEAVFYSIYGYDPTPSNLAVTSQSAIAQKIKEKLDISGATWGISQTSVFGNTLYNGSAINNEMCPTNIGQQEVASDENLAFFPYSPNYSPDYSYFDVMSVDSREEFGYPAISFKLRQNVIKNDANYNSFVSTVEGGNITVVGDSSHYVYGTTNANGIAEFTVNYPDTSPTQSFVLRSDSTGNNPAYLRVSYSFDGSAVSNLKVSEVVADDTSLSSFEIDGENVAPLQAQNLEYKLISSASNATLKVVPRDAAAEIKDRKIYLNGSAAVTGFGRGEAQLSLANGKNVIKFTVVNGAYSEVYELTVMKSASSSDNASAVTRVINGIADYSGSKPATYDYNWVLSKLGAGKQLTSAEKTAFLNNVLRDANGNSLSCGSYAKEAIALAALHIDATKIPNTSGGTDINLLDKVFVDASGIGATDIPYVLMLMDLGVYESKNDNCTRAQLIQKIISTHDGSSGWGKDGWMGVDTTALMLPALAKYYKAAGTGIDGISAEQCNTIKGIVDTEIGYFSSIQDTATGSIAGNSNSTAVVISALSAYGINADTDSDFIKNEKSLIDGLLLFESTDHRLGYTSRTYNDYASVQGLEALGNYKDALAGGDGNDYSFNATVAPYVNWPSGRILTDIIVTSPTKSTYNSGDSFETAGMVVKAVYNGDASTSETVNISDCSLSISDGTSLNTVGVNTVEVSYGGVTKTFNIIVNESSSVPYETKTVDITVKSNKGVVASQKSLVIKENVTTVMDALKSVLNDAGKTCVIRGGLYVVSIDGLGEFDKGADSGWMYNVNGKTPQVAANEYKLKAGDQVLWYYTLDYKTDSRNTGMKGNGDANAEEGSGKAASAEVSVQAQVIGGKATADISNGEISKAIENVNKQAKDANLGEKNVVLEVKNEKQADGVEANIPGKALGELAGSKVTTQLKTDCGSAEFSPAAMNSIADQVGNGNLMVSMEKKNAAAVLKQVNEGKLLEATGLDEKALGNASITDVTFMTNGHEINSFDGNKIRLLLNVAGNQIVGSLYDVVAISSDGSIDKMVGKCVLIDGKKFADISTGHTTTFIVTENEVNNPFEDVNAGDYFYMPVLWAVEKKVTGGVSANAFAPENACTRAQMVTFLHRAAGSPWASANKDFEDVAKDAYYADAVAWAVASGITTGVSEKDFDPNGQVTREQLASFIYRYAKSKGQGFSDSRMFNLDFNDAGSISTWADEAMHWCVMNDIVTGTGDKTLNPKGKANRGQIVTMLYRYFMLRTNGVEN